MTADMQQFELRLRGEPFMPFRGQGPDGESASLAYEAAHPGRIVFSWRPWGKKRWTYRERTRAAQS